MILGLKPLFTMFGSLKREFWMVALFSFVANLLMIAPSLYMLQVFDRVLISQNLLTLIASTVILVFMLSMVAFSEWGRSRLLVRIGIQLDQSLNKEVFRSSFRGQLEQPQANPAQAITDLNSIRQFLTGNGVFAFFDLPWVPIYIAVLYLLHPVLGYLGVFFAVVMLLLVWRNHRLISHPMHKALQEWSSLQNDQQGKLRNAETIETLGMFQALRRRWWNEYIHQFDVQGKVDQLGNHVGAISKFLRYSKQSLALGAGAWLVIHGELTPGAMIAGNVLMTRALQPIDLIVNAWKGYVTARTAQQRIDKLRTSYSSEEVADVVQSLHGEIELIDVTASVKGREQPILRNTSLSMNPGTITVIMGASGSGKSTLLRTLLGLWPVTSGEVLLDQVPVGLWERVELGQQLGYLPQDVELMEGSIAQNIARFGEVDADKVIEAAQIAGVHEMILRFPQGYDMEVGAGGGILSAGQRQRVALARALYKKPPVVVLDEPNANLDEAGEIALVKAIQQLKAAQCAVILVTHRKGIVDNADQVVTLKGGVIQSVLPAVPVKKENS